MKKIKRLGIIGAENSHSFKIAEICNIRKAVPLRVTHLWGETDEAAASSATKGNIPTIVSDWRSMAGEVDGVMIDHRHGAAHADVARHFIQAGIPTFVDKPMTCSLAEAKELFDEARKRSCPLMTFSLKPLQKSFQTLLKNAGPDTVRIFNSSGPSDLKSKHGGIFFYGIHQVDCAVEALGTEAVSVFLQESGANAIATIEFAGDRLATLNLIAGHPAGFHWRFCTTHGDFSEADKPDRHPYLNSARVVSDFLKTGQAAFSQERMLAPIAILEALQASYELKARVNISPL